MRLRLVDQLPRPARFEVGEAVERGIGRLLLRLVAARGLAELGRGCPRRRGCRRRSGRRGRGAARRRRARRTCAARAAGQQRARRGARRGSAPRSCAVDVVERPRRRSALPSGLDVHHLPADHARACPPPRRSRRRTCAQRRRARRPAAAFSATSRKASVSSASPARIAMASPNTLWLVGRPRRKSSSSIAGRSSWISEYVWIISSAHADRHHRLRAAADRLARRRSRGSAAGACRRRQHAVAHGLVDRGRGPPSRAAAARSSAASTSVAPRLLAGTPGEVHAHASLVLPGRAAGAGARRLSSLVEQLDAASRPRRGSAAVARQRRRPPRTPSASPRAAACPSRACCTICSSRARRPQT